MFGKEFQDRWYKVPGVPGLELSGDLRFRGPKRVRKTRHDAKGRPYVMAHRSSRQSTDRIPRGRRVIAECRGRLTFLFRTQLFPWILRISLVFPASEVRDLSPF